MFLVGFYNQLQPLPSIEGLTPQKKLLRAIVTAATTLPFVIGGMMLLFGFNGGLYWAAVRTPAKLTAPISG